MAKDWNSGCLARRSDDLAVVKRLWRCGPWLALFVAIWAFPVAAHRSSYEAKTIRPAQLHLGPAPTFKRGDVVPKGRTVVVSVCIPDFIWCRIEHEGKEVWIAGRDIVLVDNSGRAAQTAVESGHQVGVPIFRPPLRGRTGEYFVYAPRLRDVRQRRDRYRDDRLLVLKLRQAQQLAAQNARLDRQMAERRARLERGRRSRERWEKYRLDLLKRYLLTKDKQMGR